jgi:hypothetical protein
LALLLAACATETPQAALLEKASQGLSAARPTSWDLRLTCAPEDSQVWLDGVPVGNCVDFSGRPKGLHLGSKMRKVEVKREGYMPFETYIEPDGTRATLYVTLAPSNLGGAP